MSIEILSAGKRVVTALVNGEEIIVSREVIKERAMICGRCAHNNHGRCDICRCYLHLKRSLTTEGCPLGYWDSTLDKKG